jgi:tetratricopeptide (TPR) repeat protein
LLVKRDQPEQTPHGTFFFTKKIFMLQITSSQHNSHHKTTQAMEIITLLNNKAIMLIKQGDFQEAVFVCRIALDKLLSRGREGQHEDVDLAGKVTRNFLSVRSIPLQDSFSLLKPSSYQDNHAFSLFDRALVVDYAELEAVSSVAAQTCMSAVVLFNMGLAFHIQGVHVHGLCRQTTSFKKAMKLYTVANDILEGCADSGGELYCLLHLSLFNNMGYIYSHFCETSDAQRCFKLLQAVLQVMEYSGEDIPGDEFVPFHTNVLVLIVQDALRPPAGAA